MAHIHILEGHLRERVNGILSGSFGVVFHIPINNPIAAAEPTEMIESAVPDISPTEQGNLNNGTLLEISEGRNYSDNNGLPHYARLIKERWNTLNVEKNQEYDFEYQFLGKTLSAQ